MGQMESIDTAAYLIIDKETKRTVKVMCCISRGVPIVNIKWLQESARKGEILPWDKFVMSGSVAEENFGFTFKESLKKRKENGHGVLDGFTVFVPRRTFKFKDERMVNPDDIRRLVSSAGGTWLTKVNSKECGNLLVLCTEKAMADKDIASEAWEAASRAPNEQGRRVYKINFLYDCAVQQRLDWSTGEHFHPPKQGPQAGRDSGSSGGGGGDGGGGKVKRSGRKGASKAT